MSLILEALRKSEAQRQLGRAPGVLAPMPAARRSRARWPFALLASSAIVVAGGWIAWPRLTAPARDHRSEVRQAPASPVPPAALAERRIEIVPRRASAAAAPAAAAAQPEPAPTPTPTPTPAPGVSAASASTSAAPPASTTDPLPGLADLLPGERAALPPLRISMHVFAKSPAARFVIIDGKRVGEGALLAEDVVLRAIDRDGIVIDAHGRALRVLRP